MDTQAFLEFATVVTKLKMYPYFDVAHYTLMCISVRDDNVQQSGSGGQLFSRKHPLSCWFASMLMCFAGGILSSLLLGESLATPLKDHQAMMTASIVWYMVNYFPFDLVYRATCLAPVKAALYCLKEVQRGHKVHAGVVVAMKQHPGSYLLIAVVGMLKGAGYTYIRLVERMFRGVWVPASNEFMQSSYVTKASLLAAITFMLERSGYLDIPHAFVALAVTVAFIIIRLFATFIRDPFVPVENLFCAVFMGGMWNALRRATKPRVAETSNGIKTTDEKKTD